MTLPPQKCPRLVVCRDTCHGQLCGIASTPPTTRTLTLGRTAGRPHSATPGGIATPLTLGGGGGGRGGTVRGGTTTGGRPWRQRQE